MRESTGTERGPCHPIAGVVYRGEEEIRRHVACGDWMDATLGDALRRKATAHPGKAAVITEGGVLNFADLNSRSEAVAAGLLDAGLRPGDRMLWQVGTNSEFFIAFYGCLKAGLVPVCTLPQFRALDMREFASRSGARGMVVQADVNPNFDQLAFARDLVAEIPGMDHLLVVRGKVDGGQGMQMAGLERKFDPETAHALVARHKVSAQDVALFQLSGGSTSLPKIIPRFHGEYLAAARQLGERYELTGEDVSLWNLPLIHNAGGLFVVVPVALEGRTVVLQPALDARRMLELIGQHCVTFSGSIGPVAARLLEVEDIDRYDLSSLRQFFGFNRAEALEARLGVPTGQMFGMTEGMVMAAAPSAPEAMRFDTVGHPVCPRDEVRLVDPESGDEVPFGELGELTYRGPQTMTGYFREDAANAAAMTEYGFVRTGDLMRAHLFGETVAYSFEGRIKDNINRGGEKIGAEEIEVLLGQHPNVADAKVVAMPDEIYGEKACAYVIWVSGATPLDVAELREFMLSKGAAKYKCPERVETVDAFPLTRVGKADKAALRRDIADKLKQEAGKSGTGR